MPFRGIWAALILAGLTTLPFAHADWQGIISLKISYGSENIDGKGSIRSKGTKTRVDMVLGKDKITVISDPAGKSWGLSPKYRIAVAQDDASPTGFPECNAKNIDACYRNAKEIGTETVLGHECTIYKKKRNGFTIKLWRPNDLKDVELVKTIVQKKSKPLLTLEISEINTSPQNEADFAIPPDYSVIRNQKTLRRLRAATTAYLPAIRPRDDLFIDTAAYKSKSPERGDLVAWRRPGETKKVRIGRVVALPRERIAFHDRTFFITGLEVQERRIQNSTCEEVLAIALRDPESIKSEGCFEENLRGFKHMVLHSLYGNYSNIPPIEIWTGDYYVLPDYRDLAESISKNNLIKQNFIFGKVYPPLHEPDEAP